MGVSSILFLLGASSLWGDSRPNKVTQTASESLVGLITTLGLLAGYVELTKRLINKTRVKEQTDYVEVIELLLIKLSQELRLSQKASFLNQQIFY